MSFEEDEVPGDFFCWVGWNRIGIFELFVSKYPQLTWEPKEQTVFLMGAVVFSG